MQVANNETESYSPEFNENVIYRRRESWLIQNPVLKYSLLFLILVTRNILTK